VVTAVLLCSEQALYTDKGIRMGILYFFFFSFYGFDPLAFSDS
jgi:hypothetical protein